MRIIQRVLYISIVLFFSCNKSADKKKIISGYSFGTSFSVQFEKNNNENVVKNKIDFLYFGDSNVGMFNRDVDFIRHIAKRRNETGYPRQIDYSTAKQQPKRIVELGEILNKEAKIRRGVTIALQSMNPKTLKAIKRINLANEKLEQIVSDYNKAGVDNYCELIVGLPEETLDSWIEGIGKILELGSDHALTVHPLSIVPNTPFSILFCTSIKTIIEDLRTCITKLTSNCKV